MAQLLLLVLLEAAGNDLFELLSCTCAYMSAQGWRPPSCFDLEAANSSAGVQTPCRQLKNAVPVVTVETSCKAEEFPVPGAPGRMFTNLGRGERFPDHMTKARLFQRWLQSRKDPEEIVIFTDARDILFGGCSEAELLERYRAVVAASGGAPVVAGAELGLWPSPSTWPVQLVGRLSRYAELAARRHAVQDVLVPGNRSYGDYALCAAESGPCSTPPEYQYLNSGFYMGPVAAMREVVECMCKESVEFDQVALMACMLERPEQVTLDYSGSIVLQLHQLKPFSTLKVGWGRLRNVVTQADQCFVHAQGTGKFSQEGHRLETMLTRWQQQRLEQQRRAEAGRLRHGGLAEPRDHTSPTNRGEKAATVGSQTGRGDMKLGEDSRWCAVPTELFRGGGIGLRLCDGSLAQAWTHDEEDLLIRSAAAPDLCLSFGSFNRRDGGILRLEPCVGGRPQQWSYQHQKMTLSADLQWCLSLHAALPEGAGATINLWPCGSSHTMQSWSFLEHEKAFRHIRSCSSFAWRSSS